MKLFLSFAISVLLASLCCMLDQEVLQAKSGEPPYIEEDIVFSVKDIALAGTLTFPRNPGPHPAVVLIAGGEPDDRDATVGSFKPFKALAHFLAPRGIAVLRYDDRGVGKSGGKHTWQYTVEDTSEDVLAAIKFLKNNKKIDAKQVGLCGHCGGGVAGLLAASRSRDIAFFVVLATPLTTGALTFEQARKGFLESMNKSPTEIETAIRLEKRIHGVVRSGKGMEELKADILKNARSDFETLQSEQKKFFKDFDTYFASTYDGKFITVMQTPYYRHFIDYDPLPSLKNIRCPLLVLFGEADPFVPAALHHKTYLEILNETGHTDHVIRTVPKANHVFAEDWTSGKFVPGFLKTVSDWLLQRVEIKKRYCEKD
jgi:pimeloyl-ACP methyl ester carboxylesterase